jgi:hypothetical protein
MPALTWPLNRFVDGMLRMRTPGGYEQATTESLEKPQVRDGA